MNTTAHEAHYLKLDSSKSTSPIGIGSPLGLEVALLKTLEWHEAWRKVKICAQLHWHNSITSQSRRFIEYG